MDLDRDESSCAFSKQASSAFERLCLSDNISADDSLQPSILISDDFVNRIGQQSMSDDDSCATTTGDATSASDILLMAAIDVAMPATISPQATARDRLTPATSPRPEIANLAAKRIACDNCSSPANPLQ